MVGRPGDPTDEHLRVSHKEARYLVDLMRQVAFPATGTEVSDAQTLSDPSNATTRLRDWFENAQSALGEIYPQVLADVGWLYGMVELLQRLKMACEERRQDLQVGQPGTRARLLCVCFSLPRFGFCSVEVRTRSES